jgi:hypothetical protein
MTVQASWYDDPDPYGKDTSAYDGILDHYVEDPDVDPEDDEHRPESD